MSRSDWSVVAAIIGCLILMALALANSHLPHKTASASYTSAAQHNSPQQQSATERGGLPSFIERAISNAEPVDESEQETRDLAAQEASAVWGFWSICIAGLSTVVTALGTALLYQQILLTRKAVEDTGAATEAMREANVITETIGKAQVRAYISIRAISFRLVQAKGGFQFEIELINSGQSPARRVQLRTMLNKVTKGVPTMVRQRIDPFGDIAQAGPLKQIIVLPAPEDIAAQLIDTFSHLSVDVVAEYKDVFGISWADEFTFDFLHNQDLSAFSVRARRYGITHMHTH